MPGFCGWHSIRERRSTLPHLGPLADELDSWGIGQWSPLGEKVLASPINWKLAIDTFAENYHFATVHKNTFATIARSNRTVFDAFGPHHRLVFPLNGISGLDKVPEGQCDPLQNVVVIYAHSAVRDEHYALVEKLQANLESGARSHLVFGRNEPGLHHRHSTWSAAIAKS